MHESRKTRKVEVELSYVVPGSFVNRRFVSPGQEVNTGRYESHRVEIGDARDIAGEFTFDTNGFVLAPHRSAVRDYFDVDEVDAVYPDEVVETVKTLTGADRVSILLGGKIVASGT